MSIALPHQVKKYFWGDDLTELAWPKHKRYIIQTLLDKGDHMALHWLFSQVSHDEIKKILPNLKMTTKSNNFWQIYLS